MRIRSNLPVIISALFGVAVLCGLGVWQLKRLAWKEALIVALEQRMKQKPVSLSEALRRNAAGEDVEYLRVAAHGMPTKMPLLKQTTFRGLAGWEGLLPYRMDDGTEILVDMGAAGGRPGAALETLVDVDGVLRVHNKGRGYFDPENDVAGNIWHWWDIPGMQKAAAIPGEPKPIIQLLPDKDLDFFTPAEPKIELANNHLGYAITWFGLAAALAGVAGAFVFRRGEG